MTYIKTSLRRLVIARAGGCCEYCLLGQEDNFLPFAIDHIRPEEHGGPTEEQNLCLSCYDCNSYKSSDVGSFDPLTDEFTFFYNPRKHTWSEHFRVDNGVIEPLTAEARVTVLIFRINLPEHVDERLGLIKIGRYPCQKNQQS